MENSPSGSIGKLKGNCATTKAKAPRVSIDTVLAGADATNGASASAASDDSAVNAPAPAARNQHNDSCCLIGRLHAMIKSGDSKSHEGNTHLRMMTQQAGYECWFIPKFHCGTCGPPTKARPSACLPR